MRNLPRSELQRSCHCGTCMTIDTSKSTNTVCNESQIMTQVRTYTQACAHTNTWVVANRNYLTGNHFLPSRPPSPHFHEDNDTLSLSRWSIVDLYSSSLSVTLSILLCLIHGNYARECADVRLADCCIFHRRLELMVKCLISCGFISTCLTFSYVLKKACWGMIRGHVSMCRRHPSCCHTAGLVFSVAKVPALTKWRNFTGGMGRSVCL